MFAPRFMSLLLLSTALISGCHRSQSPGATFRRQTPKQAVPVQLRTQHSPQLLPEVQAAIARTYKEAVTINTRHLNPFVTGDFNGDNSEDIAIIVNPAKGMLEELNSEYANWTLDDALKCHCSPNTSSQAKALVKTAKVLIRRKRYADGCDSRASSGRLARS